MTEHTPGPWFWNRGPGSSFRAIESDASTVLVGDCGRNECNRTELFIGEADARLIAAAPELLAALKKCAVYAHLPEIDQEAWKAIAKAEGK